MGFKYFTCCLLLYIRHTTQLLTSSNAISSHITIKMGILDDINGMVTSLLNNTSGTIETNDSSFLSKLSTSNHGIPTNGIINYKGRTKFTPSNEELPGSVSSHLKFKPMTNFQLFQTKFNLWKQLPWKKIAGKPVLKLRLSGSFPLESARSGGIFGLGGSSDLETVESLSDLWAVFNYAASDPRIQAIYVELSGVNCGYAKLKEIRRFMNYFQQSGKKIIGYADGVSEKEFYLSLGFDEFYIPPDGGLDLRGFSAAASFVRGVLDKIGIEPQVQRIGKYKSAGDQINRVNISDAQREVISSLLTEASEYWLNNVAISRNKTLDEVRNIWIEESIKTPYDYKLLGFITGVKYVDQVEQLLLKKYPPNKSNNILNFLLSENDEKNDTILTEEGNEIQKEKLDLLDFNMTKDFELYPRRSIDKIYSDNTDSLGTNSTETLNRTEVKQKTTKISTYDRTEKNNFLPSGLYLRKMRLGNRILKGLQYKEINRGPRIAIINAVGAINSGSSGNSGLSGQSLGSDTLIAQLRVAKEDRNIKGVVIRVDSPGGSALASDLMWREVRSLSRLKPVVASMVDVAASGGYYISMACDHIVAEDLTITGSIGVVTAKFNSEKFNKQIGYGVESISIGRYAE
eukprot:gene11828-15829_t